MVTASNTAIEVTAAGAPPPVTAEFDPEAMHDHAAARFERLVDAANRRTISTARASVPASLRLLVMRHVIERSLALLPMRVGTGS